MRAHSLSSLPAHAHSRHECVCVAQPGAVRHLRVPRAQQMTCGASFRERMHTRACAFVCSIRFSRGSLSVSLATITHRAVRRAENIIKSHSHISSGAGTRKQQQFKTTRAGTVEEKIGRPDRACVVSGTHINTQFIYCPRVRALALRSHTCIVYVVVDVPCVYISIEFTVL